MLDLDKALNSALEAARIGREIIMKYYGRIRDVHEKEHAGLVSEADRESEVAITQYLRQKHPEFSVLGEEESFAKQGFGPVEKMRKSGLWLVDPLDGTTNYIHRLPIFCVSIGLEYQGELQVAVVDVPTLQKVYSAARGRGAFVNGERMKVSDRADVRSSLLATGFTSYNPPTLPMQIQIFSDLVGEARGVRRAGSAAYDLCLVAEGVFDGYWEPNLQPWDSAAGTLLVREAGGIVTEYSGEPYHPFASTLIAANPKLYPVLQKVISRRVGRSLS